MDELLTTMNLILQLIKCVQYQRTHHWSRERDPLAAERERQGSLKSGWKFLRENVSLQTQMKSRGENLPFQDFQLRCGSVSTVFRF